MLGPIVLAFVLLACHHHDGSFTAMFQPPVWNILLLLLTLGKLPRLHIACTFPVPCIQLKVSVNIGSTLDDSEFWSNRADESSAPTSPQGFRNLVTTHKLYGASCARGTRPFPSARSDQHCRNKVSLSYYTVVPAIHIFATSLQEDWLGMAQNDWGMFRKLEAQSLQRVTELQQVNPWLWS